MKPIFILLVLIVLVSSACAAPPAFQVSSNSIQIESPHFTTVKVGAEHRFHAHVINSTRAKTNLTTSCALHVYNQTGWDIEIGNQWMEFETYNGIDFAKTIDGKNFSKTGIYGYVIQCNSSTEVGFYENSFEVTPTGIESTIQRTLTNTFSIFSMFLVSLMLFVGFMFIKNSPIKFSVATLSAIFFLIGINLILNLLTNEVVDPNMVTLFDTISAASYYFYWLGGGLILILLFIMGLMTVKEVIEKNKVRKYGGFNE